MMTNIADEGPAGLADSKLHCGQNWFLQFCGKDGRGGTDWGEWKGR